MLTRWLPTDEENLLPPNASHQVGIGAFIVNGEGKVLLVQERRGPAAASTRPDFWKLPTVRATSLRVLGAVCVVYRYARVCVYEPQRVEIESLLVYLTDGFKRRVWFNDATQSNPWTPFEPLSLHLNSRLVLFH